jgi:parallel beta-helix repeat protein
VIQNANDNCPALGCTIYIEGGTYSLTQQVSGLQNYQNGGGLQLSSNVQLLCQSNSVVQFTTGAIPGAANVAYFVAITNKNRASTGDSFIHIVDCGFNLPAPTATATGLKAWDSAIQFEGCNRCLIKHVWINQGSIALRPTSSTVNTANVLSTGKNYENIVEDTIIENEPESSWFFQSANSTFINSTINKCWDDCFLIASAGVDNKILHNTINEQEVVAGKGASTAAIYLQNDLAGWTDNGHMRDNIVAYNTVLNATAHNSGGNHGIYLLRDNATLVEGNIIKYNFGRGIQIEDSNNFRIISNTIYKNGQDGIRIIENQAGTHGNYQIIDNVFYNNGAPAQGNAAIQMASSAGQTLKNIIIIGNLAYDDLVSHLQNNLVRFVFDGTITNVYVEGNNVVNSPGFIQTGGAGTFSNIQILNNLGWNPYGKTGNFVFGSIIAPWGAGSTVLANTDYSSNGPGFWFTSSGGTSVNITIKDTATNTLYAPGATLAVPFFVAYNYKVNFGGFSVAPTVSVWFD